jgi:hypothetical protein
VTPQCAAGHKIEPQVSLPSANAAWPDATMAPERRACHGGRREAVAEAAGELDHGRFAEQHGAGFGQSLDDGRVFGQLLFRQRRRAPRRRIPADREQIFGGVRDAVQRAAPIAGGDLVGRAVRLMEREVARDRDPRVLLVVERLGAIEVRGREVDGRQRFRAQLLGQLVHAGEEHIEAEVHQRCVRGARNCSAGSSA